MNNLPKRKIIRLQNYDYSQNGAYFITICTQNRAEILWNSVGATCGRQYQSPELSRIGLIVDNEIALIPTIYPNVFIDKYIIMPNHIHMIVMLQNDESGRPQVAPTISRIIQQFKGSITKKIGYSICQKSFYEHIIRNEEDYKEIWNYIDTNSLTWENDDLNKKKKTKQQINAK